MTRFQLEHIIRAAGAITECDDFVIIGSQAIHASLDNLGVSFSVFLRKRLVNN